jgi:hypothetical protein
MSKHKELGPEPFVNMGDHAAAQKRADQVQEFLDSTRHAGTITQNERVNLYHLRDKWLKRARGESWFFENFGTEPRAYNLLEFRMEGGLHKMRRGKDPNEHTIFDDPPKRKRKIHFKDPERTGFEEEKDISYAGLRRKDGRVKKPESERTPFDSLYNDPDEDYGNQSND